MDILDVSHHGSFAYQIRITEGFEELGKALLADEFRIRSRKVLIVTDSNVEALQLEPVKEALCAVAKEVHHYTFIPGEEHKHLDALSGLYACLIEGHYDRNDLLVALGGGSETAHVTHDTAS